jgi:hypothetical protein
MKSHNTMEFQLERRINGVTMYSKGGICKEEAFYRGIALDRSAHRRAPQTLFKLHTLDVKEEFVLSSYCEDNYKEEVVITKTKYEPMKFRVEHYVNGEQTAIVENLTKEQAYSENMPAEEGWGGSRWHILTRPEAFLKLVYMDVGDSILLAFQHESETPGLDIETIYATRTR